MSKSKAISKSNSKNPAKAEKPSSARRNGSTHIAALPLGFASIFGLLAFASLCGQFLIAPSLFSGFWPSSYEYWPQAMFLALTAMTCVLLALEPIPKLPNAQTSKLLALFFAWCALSIVGTVYLHDSILELARVTGVLAWFFIARALLRNREYFAQRVLWISVFIAAGLLLVCLPAIFDFFKTHNPRQFATFYNPNLFANYCAMSLPLCRAGILGLWREAQRRDKTFESKLIAFMGIVIFTIIASGLFLTSSKGGFLAVLCGLAVFVVAVFIAKRESVRGVLRARRGVIATVVLMILLGGGVLFSKTIAPRLSVNLLEDHSTMFRVYTWKGTLKMASARPVLGFGPCSFPSAYTRFAETGFTRTAHQLWLQLAAECGFPAMLLLLLACGMSTLSGWRALQSDNWIFAAGGLGALTAFIIHGLTDAGWSIISIATLAMIVLALLESSSFNVERSTLDVRRSNLNWFWLLAALPLTFGSWITHRAQAGEDLRSESRELISRGAPRTALEKAVAAKNADPLSARLTLNLAQTESAAPKAIPSSGNYWRYHWLHKWQPTRALNYLSSAEYWIEANKSSSEIANLFDKAVQYDPNDTEIRLARGKWKLDNNHKNEWRDIEYIAALKDEPYGKYPATPEMVDLNYARAYAMLAERDSKNQKVPDAKKWIARGFEVVAEARKFEPQRRAMEQATQGSIDYSREQTMNELEAQFKSLQEKVQ